MKKVFLACAMAAMVTLGNGAQAQIGCMYDSQHDIVVYNTSKKATSLTNIATLDFYKTITRSNEAYYHAIVKVTGLNEMTKAEPYAMLIIDNKMHKIFPTPFNKYDVTNGRETYILKLDYVIPNPLAMQLKNYKSQIGLQIFVEGEKSRILSLDEEGNAELKLITDLKFSDYAGVQNGKIAPAKTEV